MKEAEEIEFWWNIQRKNHSAKQTSKPGTLVTEDMSLVKGLNQNLLSIKQLCDKGFKINFEEGKCIGSDNYQK